MAALSVGLCWCSNKKIQLAGHKFTNRNIVPKIFVPLCCQSRKPVSNEEKKDIGGEKNLLNGFEKLIGKKPQEKNNFSPQQQKGDWKDLFLMSISFAVYVYISQKLVCAYYAWNSMPKPLW